MNRAAGAEQPARSVIPAAQSSTRRVGAARCPASSAWLRATAPTGRRPSADAIWSVLIAHPLAPALRQIQIFTTRTGLAPRWLRRARLRTPVPRWRCPPSRPALSRTGWGRPAGSSTGAPLSHTGAHSRGPGIPTCVTKETDVSSPVMSFMMVWMRCRKANVSHSDAFAACRGPVPVTCRFSCRRAGQKLRGAYGYCLLAGGDAADPPQAPMCLAASSPESAMTAGRTKTTWRITASCPSVIRIRRLTFHEAAEFHVNRLWHIFRDAVSDDTDTAAR